VFINQKVLPKLVARYAAELASTEKLPLVLELISIVAAYCLSVESCSLERLDGFRSLESKPTETMLGKKFFSLFADKVNETMPAVDSSEPPSSALSKP